MASHGMHMQGCAHSTHAEEVMREVNHAKRDLKRLEWKARRAKRMADKYMPRDHEDKGKEGKGKGGDSSSSDGEGDGGRERSKGHD